MSTTDPPTPAVNRSRPPTNLALDLLSGAGASHTSDLGYGINAADDGKVGWLRERQIDSLLFFRQAGDQPQQRLYNFIWTTQRQWCIAAVSALAAAGVRAIVFKGAEFFERHFAPEAVGIMHDIDLLVEMEQIPDALDILKQLGFRQDVVWPDGRGTRPRSPEELNAFLARHYELAPLVLLHPIGDSWTKPEVWPMVRVEGELFLAVYIDLHFGVAINIPGAPFFDRAEASVFRHGLTMCAADHLWFVASRLYSECAFHGKVSLRDLAYLVALVRKTSIAWDVVEDAAARYSLGPLLYYVLTFLQRLTGINVPPQILASCDPTSRTYRRDAGPQLHLWMGVDTFDSLRNHMEEMSLRGGPFRHQAEKSRYGKGDPRA